MRRTGRLDKGPRLCKAGPLVVIYYYQNVEQKGEAMDNKKLGLGLLAVAGAFWIATFIGMLMESSHQWTEPVQQLGWIFFIVGFLVLYLRAGREIVRPQMAALAWLSGLIAMVLFLICVILNVTSETPEQWFEAFEAAASIAMLVSIMTAIWSVGGWKSEPESLE
jgi:hypothetical protein